MQQGVLGGLLVSLMQRPDATEAEAHSLYPVLEMQQSFISETEFKPCSWRQLC